MNNLVHVGEKLERSVLMTALTIHGMVVGVEHGMQPNVCAGDVSVAGHLLMINVSSMAVGSVGAGAGRLACQLVR
jgi:hypothetical protein